MYRVLSASPAGACWSRESAIAAGVVQRFEARCALEDHATSSGSAAGLVWPRSRSGSSRSPVRRGVRYLRALSLSSTAGLSLLSGLEPATFNDCRGSTGIVKPDFYHC